MKYWHCMAAAFLLNGLSCVGMKLLPELGLTRATPLALAAMYGVCAAAALAHLLSRRWKLQKRSLWLGLAAGLSSIGCVACSIYALDLLPGYVAFPLFAGGTILLVALAGRFLFGEKIGPYGAAGIAAGVLAIVLLAG